MTVRSLSAAGLAALSLALTGCYGIQSETLTQKDVIGDVHVKTTICGLDPGINLSLAQARGLARRALHGKGATAARARGVLRRSVRAHGATTGKLVQPSDGALSCDEQGFSWFAVGQLGSELGQYPFQLILAYRVPDGVTAPETLAATDGVFTTTLVRAGDIAAALPEQAAHDTPAGSHWVGYRAGGTEFASPDLTFGDLVDGPDLPATDTWTVEGDFGIPHGEKPFPGPFAHDVAMAWRMAMDDTLPGPKALAARARARAHARRLAFASAAASSLALDRALDCDETLGGDPSTWCGLQTDDARLDRSLATNDLGVAAPAVAPEIAQGQSGSLTFPVAFAGPAGPQFSFTASTTVPGGSASPADTTLAPGADATAPEAVTVTVPEGTPLGTYDVTLTATGAGGQQRSGTGHVTVVEAPKPPPAPPAPPVKTQAASLNLPSMFELMDSATPDGNGDVVTGLVHCWQPTGRCSAPLYLMTTQGQLQPGLVRSASVERFRLVVLARTRVEVKAGGTAKIRFHVGPKVRRMLASGHTVQARISTRPKWAASPSSRRIWLRPGTRPNV